MTTLFPGGQFPGSGGSGVNSAALSLKWGKCFVVDLDSGKKFKVTADKRKGQLSLFRKGMDGMNHLKWKDRSTGSEEEDLFIFPGEQTVERVDTGRPDDRVWLLQFKNGKRLFFWSQEFDEEAEKEKVEDLGKFLKDPSTIPAVQAAAASGGPAGAAAGGGSQADQLRAFLGGAAGGGAGGGNISETDLRAILQSMGGGVPAPAAPQAAQPGPPPAPAGDAAPASIGEFQEDEMLRMAIEASMREASGAPSSGGDAEGSEGTEGEGKKDGEDTGGDGNGDSASS
jgi:hypothetical protein